MREENLSTYKINVQFNRKSLAQIEPEISGFM